MMPTAYIYSVIQCICFGRAANANRLATPTYHYAPMLPLLATVPRQYRDILYNSIIPLQETLDREKGFILLILLLIKNGKTVCIFSQGSVHASDFLC
jgi:hypothetical protein